MQLSKKLWWIGGAIILLITAGLLLAGQSSGNIESIEGTDANQNGIRDDVDAYIDKLPDTKEQKAALRQLARAINETLTVNLADEDALAHTSQKISNAASCMRSRYESFQASKMSEKIEKLTVNTEARYEVYDKYSTALSGTVFSLPEGDGCEL